MDYTIIDAHAHLWLRQDTVVDGLPIRTLENGGCFTLSGPFLCLRNV